MSSASRKKDTLEVASETLQAELIAIKDRLSAIETIESISNRHAVEAFVRENLPKGKGKLVLIACEKSRTRKELIDEFGFDSYAALDYHLKPLREADLVRQATNEDGTQTFEWSNLFRRLPKATIRKILDYSDEKAGPKVIERKQDVKEDQKRKKTR